MASAWDWEEIGKAHRTYLQHPRLNDRQVTAIRELPALAALARIERQSYHYAFALDPLLPRALWPAAYQGVAVQQEHMRLRRLLAERFQVLNAG